MLGIDSEFSISVSHALEMWNSSFPSESIIFWLRSVTSRVVIPSRKRSSFSCSPARKVDLVSDMLFETGQSAVSFFLVNNLYEFGVLIIEGKSTQHTGQDYVILRRLQTSRSNN